MEQVDFAKFSPCFREFESYCTPLGLSPSQFQQVTVTNTLFPQLIMPRCIRVPPRVIVVFDNGGQVEVAGLHLAAVVKNGQATS
jgi:hypothetical protein